MSPRYCASRSALRDLVARLRRAVVHALVADQLREEIDRFVRDRRSSVSGHAATRPCGCHAVHEHAVLLPALGLARRARGARGGRTSRSRPSCPSAASGTPRATARRRSPGRARARRSRSCSMRSAWCSLIASTRPGDVGERMAVRGQAELHAVELRRRGRAWRGTTSASRPCARPRRAA